MQVHGKTMKLKECSAKQLKRISRNKKIICFGAGGNLFYTFNAYKELQLEKRILFVVDNDISKIGKTIDINGMNVVVKSPQEIADVSNKECIVLITALRSNEIFAQIQNICGNSKMNVYKAPNRKYGMTRVLERMLCKLPLKNYIILRGEGETCDNTVALGKYISNNNYFDKYKLIWLCNHPEKFINTRNEKYIHIHSHKNSKSFKEVLRYYWYMARAKFIFYENLNVNKLRSDQILVYLNHGSPPIKATKGIINLPNELNYALSPSEFSSKIITEQYSVNKERILINGSPRTDVLFEDGYKNEVKELLNFDQYKKVILWVPTFRQIKNSTRVDSNMKFELGIPVVESLESLSKLEKELEKENILLVLKPHQVQDSQCIKVGNSKWFKTIFQEELSDLGINIYDVMKVVDGMITDYSTIAFDYMLLDRPIGYTLDDMESYKIGFSVPNVKELMPGEKIYDMDDLFNFIKNVSDDIDTFKKERNHINEIIHKYLDGYNCERLCKRLNIYEVTK